MHRQDSRSGLATGKIFVGTDKSTRLGRIQIDVIQKWPGFKPFRMELQLLLTGTWPMEKTA
jgi:hypothetical protein